MSSSFYHDNNKNRGFFHLIKQAHDTNLPEDLYSQLITLARAENAALAKTIRDAISKGISKTNKDKNDILKLAGLNLHGGPKDLSSKIDKYLHDK